jgi:hypothetical protein
VQEAEAATVDLGALGIRRRGRDLALTLRAEQDDRGDRSDEAEQRTHPELELEAVAERLGG